MSRSLIEVELVCFGAMRDYLPGSPQGNRARLKVPEGSRVRDVVALIGAPADLVFSVLLDGIHGHLDSRLEGGEEITLMPPFAGGGG